MIKTGIVDGGSSDSAELLRILLHHPDVDLRWVMNIGHAGRHVTDVHHFLVGDTDLEFVDTPQWDNVDVVFLTGELCMDDDWMAELPESLRIINLTPRSGEADEQESGFVYGLSEANRRRLVHDCRRVVCPGDMAMALSLCLLPLAKNLMLNSDMHCTMIVGNQQGPAGSRVRMLDVDAYRGQLDEVRRLLSGVQSSYDSAIHFTAMQACYARGLLLTVYLKCAVDVVMVRQLFEQYYDDHHFTYLVDDYPDLGDVVGTNKCLLNIERDGDYLRITSAIDNRVKGGVGNAVHMMNLMFGLHERVGLQL